MSDDVLRARLFLMNAAAGPSMILHDFVTLHGPVEAVARIRAAAAPASVLAAITTLDPALDPDLRVLDTGTARLLTPEDDAWPHDRLNPLRASGIPLALWMRGGTCPAALLRTAVTITGACSATDYGLHVTVDFADRLSRSGVTVVSGGRLGVDERAHRMPVIQAKPTIAVLACGVDTTHPHQHARLFDSIYLAGGLLLSENPLGAKASRARSLARNRLLAALTSATVITETGKRGSSHDVARIAFQLGRAVYAVPGPVTSATSSGCHELVRSGIATLAETPADIQLRDQ